MIDLSFKRAPVLSFACYIFIITIQVQVPSAGGCFSTPKYRHSIDSAGTGSSGIEKTLGRLYDFLTLDDIHSDKNEAFAIIKNVYVNDRKAAYGRVEVPYEMSHGFTLTVATHWRRRRYNTPIWMYVRKTGLPSSSDWDKKSISFVSRKLARIRMESPDPGIYFVMIRGVEDRDEATDDLSVTVSLLPKHHLAAGNAEWRPGQPLFKSTGKTLVLSPRRLSGPVNVNATVPVTQSVP